MSEPRRRRRPAMLELEQQRLLEHQEEPEREEKPEPQEEPEREELTEPQEEPEHEELTKPKRGEQPEHMVRSQMREEPEREEQPGLQVSLSGANMHGAAARRKLQEQIRRERITFALFVLFALIAVISLTMIIKIVVRSVRTHITNRELAQRREELMAETTQSPDMIVFGPEDAQTAYEPETAAYETGEAAAAAFEAEESAAAASEDVQTQAADPEAAQAQPADSGTAETGMTDAGEALQPQATATPEPEKRDVVTSTQYHIASGTPLAHMEALYEENRDLIGWLTMDEILDLPVMYRDNSYYLKRDFYKKPNESGTLFLDVNHKFREQTQNLLLHGHNMKDGTMFGRLTQYLQDISYLKNNPFVHFDTLWRREEYVIFAVLRVSLDVKDERFFNYFSYPTFSSDAAFSSYIRQLQLRSVYAIPIDVGPGDALLTLSTCLDEDRLVIVCRRIRDGETRSQLRESIRLAVRQ